ncbi:MAG: hypothetical protein H6R16_2625 [Proteobacteria bacterium]|nr:hypothetical protein [Pseudomonadota bacterium]
MLSAALADSGDLADLNPAGTPVITDFEQNEAWKAQVLSGIHEQRTGVGFLKEQGARYPPFNRQNSLGRYDIRGLYDTDYKKE